MFTLAYVLLWVAAAAYAVLLARGGRGIGWAATGTAAGAWALLTTGLAGRGLIGGHWPLTNRYEFALCWLWAILAVYLLLEAAWRERRTGLAPLAIALVVATYALLRPADERAVWPLLPVLRSIWLQVHVLSAAIGYGACAVAAGLGILRLVGARASEEGRLPAPGDLERTMNRVVNLGFLWLTLGILSGAVWAQNAWGRYWGWDPKETWSLITWLWYLLILHLRGSRGWQGRRLTALVVAGLGLVAFTFAGLPWLVRTVRLESLHGF